MIMRVTVLIFFEVIFGIFKAEMNIGIFLTSQLL